MNESQSMETIEDSGMTEERRREMKSKQVWLFDRIYDEDFDPDLFDTNKDLLDKDIKMAVCNADTCLNPFLTKLDNNGEEEFELWSWKERVSEAISMEQCEHHEYVEEFLVCRLVHFAAMHDQYLTVLKHLHRQGCDMNIATSESGYTPLCVAVHGNQMETVKYLLSIKVDPNKGNAAPLRICVRHEYEEMFKLLLSVENIDLNHKDASGYPLLTFCIRCHPEFIEPLLEAGALPDVTSANGATPLINAVASQKEDLVKLFIKYGANVNHINGRGEVALVNPVYVENVELCRILLDAGADPNFQTKHDGNSLLLLSSYDGSLEIIKLLMKYGGNANRANKLGYTPLHIAAWNGHLSCVKELLAAGVPHDEQTTDKNTPLALAAHGGHVAVIEVLVPLICNVNNSDKDGDTPLLYASYNGLVRACELLISYGADPDMRNNVNATVLWNAVFMSKKEVVKLLLLNNVKLEVASRGIDQHEQTDHVVYIYDEPKSPLWVAVATNNPEIALLLIAAGYNLYHEKWLIDNEFPEDCDERFCQLLVSYVQNPPKLVTRCRNYLRNYFGKGIFEKVKSLPVPDTLKKYITLSDLTYGQEDPCDLEVDDTD